MVARCTPLFAVDCAPYIDAPVIVAVVGGFTALLAGIIALTQNDLKRVLAYSTISQLGYMFLALGTGSVVGILAGMFHLFTHAFFKALLFLGAGSVMHAMGGVIDIRKFGGLRRLMPWTFWTFLAGSLALAGVWPLAGFFSKDAVIASVYELGISDGPYAMAFQWLTYVAFFTAFLTSVYTFRAFWMTFYGAERIPPDAGHHAHESPAVMTVPLVVLAICAMFVGWAFGQPGDLDHGFASVVASAPSLAVMEERVDVANNKRPAATGEHGAMEHAGAEAAHVDHERIHGRVATISLSLALLGIGISAFLFQGDRREVNALARLPVFKQLYELSYGKFFFDQIYTLLVVWPGLVLAEICYFLDRYFVDGLVNAVGRLPGAVGRVLRGMQAGMIGLYALLMLLGLLTLLGSAVWQTW
jgi:NADH-quinone oxidoreductase subunit L